MSFDSDPQGDRERMLNYHRFGLMMTNKQLSGCVIAIAIGIVWMSAHCLF